MQNYTDKKFWESYYKNYQPEIITRNVFQDLFDKFLPKDSSKTILEIGCAGGKYLCYLTKKFGYQTFGIDYSEDIEKTKILFKYNNLPEPTLFKEDLFLWNPQQKFDIVCSFGFIEHFEDIRQVVQKHAELITPGGKLVITMPNFAGLQYLFHWIIDRENLKKHNVKIMKPGFLAKTLKNLPFTVEYLDYYKTFGFWTERESMKLWEKAVLILIRKFGKTVNLFFGYDRPNPLLSPHIVCIATKYENSSN